MRLDPRGGMPLYLQLSRRVRQDIESGRLSDGDAMPSEHELCRQYGVSRYTVRQALADLERDGFVERLKGKGTFVRIGRKGRKPRERDAHSPTVGLLGLVVPYITDHFLSGVIRGVEQVATENGYELVLRSSRGDSKREVDVISELRNVGLGGLLVFPTDDAVVLPALDDFVNARIPCVTLDRRLHRHDIPYVISDNQRGAAEAVIHLIDCGHERIAFAASSPLSLHTVWDRFTGYREALERRGVPYDPGLHLSAPPISRMDEREADAACEAFVKELTDCRVSAVFAVNDLVALDVMAACRTKGLRVPDDVAVVGFDDIEIAARLDVPLTTVAQHKEEMGRRATQLIFSMMRSHGRAPKSIVLETRLVVRKSCGGTKSKRGAI